jgi:plasmid stabilization system protein ParE
MKYYEVIWTNNAEFDLESIIEYIKLDSINIAKNIFFEIKEECQKLYYFPERKRIVPELQQIGITKYRELIYKRWRIIFKIKKDKVFILLVVDSSRNIEDILFQRLLKG